MKVSDFNLICDAILDLIGTPRFFDWYCAGGDFDAWICTDIMDRTAGEQESVRVRLRDELKEMILHHLGDCQGCVDSFSSPRNLSDH